MRSLPRVEVVVEPESLERTALGTISGRIWLRDGDTDTQSDFPEVGWSDLPVAILAGWLGELQRLASTVPANGAVATCRFMDGPYSFAVRADGKGTWDIRCAEERTHGRSAPGPAWLTDRANFLAGVHRAAHRVLAACDTRGWWNTDTETLRRRMESGRRFGAG